MADESTSTTDTSSIMSIIQGLGSTAAAGAATGGVGWLAAIPSLWKLGAGLFQGAKANALSKTKRPVYTPPSYSIPPEVQEYLNRTENRAIDPNLPGQSIMEQKLGANTSNAVAGVTQSGHGSGDILNTISKIYSKQNDATNDIGVAAANNYQNLTQKKEADVGQALLTSAGFKDRKYSEDLGRYKDMFQVNQLDPFNQAVGTASALRNASGKNLYGGVNDLSSAAYLLSMLKKMQANKGNTSTSTSTSTGMWDYNTGNAPAGTLVNQSTPDNLG